MSLIYFSAQKFYGSLRLSEQRNGILASLRDKNRILIREITLLNSKTRFL